MGKSALATAGQMVAAVVAAVLVSTIALIAISRVQWPAFPSSNQLHALTTVGQVGCLVLLLGTGFLWRRGRQWIARIAAAVFLSAFTVVTLGMPLGATRLYLFGISVDQQFRTEYLTRLAQSPALHDMTYIGLPPFYPAGWFWLGGRIAALTGTPAWEMLKPWAIVSIAIAVVLAMVLWSALIRFEYALIVTVATTAVTLAYSSPEPYAAIITVLIPPVLVLAWSGLRGKTRQGGWAAVIGVGLFLGVSATFYTLLVGYTAFTVVVMAVVAAIARRSVEPLLRLVLAGVIALAIAAITWLPFVLQAARHPMSDTGSAQHYLPADGAVLTFPMLQFSLLGALCMLGTLWLVWRARTSTRAAALGIGVLTVYAWSMLSMLTTLVGTTLLSFRLQPTLTVLLSAAGVFGFIDVTLAIAARTNRTVIGVGAAIGLIGAIGFSQDIPDVLRPDLTVAYTDTDGYGQRGDRRPPGAEKYYAEVDAAIQKITGRPYEDTVVLTADYSFLSYYPYYGFQGLTSHYANPLAEFDKRAAAIESWADLKTADQLVHALDTLPWQPPTVFLMRRGANDTYTLRLAQDVYPNQPNVRRYTVDFDVNLFSGPHFTVKTIGPFVLAIRNP
ncbi:galactan 5-O-arabinofuranosyltransferase [Mycobacterium crocinum]|uniref:Galactan 5-O-arabinofuranosyltransferase n=1 Tax=Mycolicibacterium crocinum TaxID=388459 RepID=A0ABY3TM15_9MYCO|nr:galactan 5-O-arabinofuranosyltransferase [Mycolicibacterium crocinum]MCV7217793.1 galactan 5-O-arabinofuranosyltransferase [Mycolicibacterium crocinum]ULN41361.1 galactan 5-O-arabinofuranosyltransferase [Mycolicibacterium crocinum]